MLQCPLHMADEIVIDAVATDSSEVENLSRIYEVGYHIVPTVKEEEVEGVVASIRAHIERAGGTFITEGAPVLTRLSYNIEAREGDRNVQYDRGYFGWIKFEAGTEIVELLESALKADRNILRCLVFRTIREETRARIKMQTIREVTRTDTIKTTARRPEETAAAAAAAPVSEEDIDKAISDLTTE